MGFVATLEQAGKRNAPNTRAILKNDSAGRGKEKHGDKVVNSKRRWWRRSRWRIIGVGKLKEIAIFCSKVLFGLHLKS